MISGYHILGWLSHFRIEGALRLNDTRSAANTKSQHHISRVCCLSQPRISTHYFISLLFNFPQGYLERFLFATSIPLSRFCFGYFSIFFQPIKIRTDSYGLRTDITIFPPSMPQQVTDNLVQKMVPVSIANQLSKYESSKHTRDVTLSGAGLIPISKPAQSSTNTGHIVYRGHTDKQLQTQYHWNRDQTHKLHLDLHLPKHHCLQQSKPKQDEEPQGVQYNWEHEKMHKLHLNLHLPQHSTECHELVADEVHVPVPIVFMLTLPALKYHERLECITYPRSTQKEYEQRMLARK